MLLQRKKRKDFDFYDYADLIFNTLSRRYIGLFNRLKNLGNYSEKEVIREVNEVYGEIDRITRKYLLLLLKKVYKEVADMIDAEDVADTVLALWVSEVLEGYDPVTKYVYVHEVDRKRARTIESIIASDNKAKEVEVAKKQWSKQAKQYCDNIVREAVNHAFEEAEVIEVEWHTEEDLRVCPQCQDLDGQRFRLNHEPPPPHYGCRCWVEPI